MTPAAAAVVWPAGAEPAPGQHIITVPTKTCCGVFVGDVCDCATWAADAAAWDAPVNLPAHSPLLTIQQDPALAGRR